jgi:hypothetical protein
VIAGRSAITREEEIMDIIIQHVDDTITERKGLPDHLSLRDNLERMGFTAYPDAPVPVGDYGVTALCIRDLDPDHEQEYEDGQYDVAELIEPEAEPEEE